LLRSYVSFAAPQHLKILALVKYGPLAASTRQRLLQYAPYLEQHGVALTLKPLLDDHYLAALMSGKQPSRLSIFKAYVARIGDILTSRSFDAIWVQYELFPYLPLMERLVTRAGGLPLVYDIDDAIFHMYDANRSTLVRRILGRKLTPMMRRAAVCLCGNSYLLDYVRAAGGKGIVLPTVVDTDVFRPVQVATGEPFTVGWIGSPSTWSYVEPLLPTLMPVIERLGGRFRVVGAGPAARGMPRIDASDWDIKREVADIQAMDVGLMPAPDEPWARGKCGYKLIQYMACGKPGVASPVGVNREIVEHGVDGFLVQTPQQWVEALTRLAANPSLRVKMGERGRERMIAGYSLASQQPIILAALRGALERGT
jgi:glycosyltransferase involved in cell wall biosynthesis